jgi:hypothetical protein
MKVVDMGESCSTYEREERCIHGFGCEDRREENTGKTRRRSEDNIKMGLKEIGIDGAKWIQLTQDRVRWRAFVNTIKNFRVLQRKQAVVF